MNDLVKEATQQDKLDSNLTKVLSTKLVMTLNQYDTSPNPNVSIKKLYNLGIVVIPPKITIK